jgi:hypothetical protein
MPKVVTILLLLGWMLVGCQPSSNPSAEKASAIMNDTARYTRVQWSDTLLDFGNMIMGDSIRLTFNCTNTGQQPLFITSVRATCGCTVPSYSQAAILPGKQGFVVASFNSNRAHPGEVYKTIYVQTNTPGGDNQVLAFSGKIVQPVQ